MEHYEDIKKDIYDQVTQELGGLLSASDEDVIGIIDKIILKKSLISIISIEDKLKIRRELFNKIRRLDVLQDMLEDDSITEIMVNGISEIFIERGGRLLGSGKAFESEERLLDIISQIASGVNRTVNIASPIMDARLLDGSRVNAVLKPIALNGPILTIRRFPDKDIGTKELLEYGSVNEEVLSFLQKLVEAGYNILISGDNVIIGLSPSDFRKRGSTAA